MYRPTSSEANTNASIYVDDCAIWETADSKKELMRFLEQDMEIIQEWAADNRIKLNKRKCSLILNDQKGWERIRVPNEGYIQSADQVKYLGITLKATDGYDIQPDFRELAASIRRRTCFVRESSCLYTARVV